MAAHAAGAHPTTISAGGPVGDSVLLSPPSAYEGAGGYPVGFPHTELGAASAAAAALEAAWTLDLDQAEQAAVLYAPPEQHDAARDGAHEAVAGWREILGLPKDGALPEGAAMQTRTIGVQWKARAKDQIQVSVLVQVTATKGVQDTDPTYSSPYAMSLLMTWNPEHARREPRGLGQHPDPLSATVPQVALPGTPEFTAAAGSPSPARRPPHRSDPGRAINAPTQLAPAGHPGLRTSTGRGLCDDRRDHRPAMGRHGRSRHGRRPADVAGGRSPVRGARARRNGRGRVCSPRPRGPGSRTRGLLATGPQGSLREGRHASREPPPETLVQPERVAAPPRNARSVAAPPQ